MSVLASLYQISKSFGTQTLFQGITFSVESGQKIGLIGPNGAGKSTLLRILAQQIEPEEGDISFGKSLKVGYMPQTPVFQNDQGLFDCIISESVDPYDSQTMAKAAEWMSRLELDRFPSEMTVGQLSGGWLKRVALARTLVSDPDLLLLDEPTNHLDLPSIQWLEDFLSQQTSLAYMLITHDRLFLQNTCDWIFDLDSKNPDGLIKLEGTYADFIELKESLFEAQKSLHASQKNVLRRETEWLRRGAKARQTKQVARIDRAEQLKNQVKNLRHKLQDRSVNFDFGKIDHLPKKIIEAVGISKSQGGQLLFKDFDFLLSPKARVGIIGSNGCGKTTLLRTLIGDLQPDTGVVKRADNVPISFFQQKKEDLNPEVSVLRTLCPEGDYVHLQGKPVFARSYLSQFRFRADQMDLPVGKISGGEQSRLLLAKMMLQAEPVLILDEPTNDLDIETLDTLESALREFPGSLILVTHDRYFMGQVCSEIFAFDENNKTLVRFADVLQWQEWQKAQGKNAKPLPPPTASADNTSEPRKPKKLSYKEQREYDMMEGTIHKEEEILENMQKEMSLPENQSHFEKLRELSEKYQKQKDKVDSLYARWEELGEKL